jgi:hypothetical protein
MYNLDIAYVVSPAPSYVWEHLIPLYNVFPGKFIHLENINVPHHYPQFNNAKELNVTIEKIKLPDLNKNTLYISAYNSFKNFNIFILNHGIDEDDIWLSLHNNNLKFTKDSILSFINNNKLPTFFDMFNNHVLSLTRINTPNILTEYTINKFNNMKKSKYYKLNSKNILVSLTAFSAQNSIYNYSNIRILIEQIIILADYGFNVFLRDHPIYKIKEFQTIFYNSIFYVDGCISLYQLIKLCDLVITDGGSTLSLSAYIGTIPICYCVNPNRHPKYKNIFKNLDGIIMNDKTCEIFVEGIIFIDKIIYFLKNGPDLKKIKKRIKYTLKWMKTFDHSNDAYIIMNNIINKYNLR